MFYIKWNTHGMEVQRQDAQITGVQYEADPSDPNPGGPWVFGTSPYWIVKCSYF
jgi:hypothetical protein